MAGPFYNAIKGTTAGAAGTGAFTPNAASTGFLAWSTVPTGWMGLVRYEDGSAWELQYSYWNGTTLSRSATAQFVSGSTGAGLTLTSAATAAMVADGARILPHAMTAMRGWAANGSSSTFNSYGYAAPTATGTAASASPTATSILTATLRNTFTSATTANASAGLNGASALLVSTTAGIGGGECAFRFGCSALPTGPRLACGLNGNVATFIASASEPSTLSNSTSVAQFIKDSTDTNIQIYTSAATTGTKVDTGIALVAGGIYDAAVWFNPGSNTFTFLLVRLDTGAIFYKVTSTTVPATGASLTPICMGSLSATTGTAIVVDVVSLALRFGGI